MVQMLGLNIKARFFFYQDAFYSLIQLIQPHFYGCSFTKCIIIWFAVERKEWRPDSGKNSGINKHLALALIRQVLFHNLKVTVNGTDHAVTANKTASQINGAVQKHSPIYLIRLTWLINYTLSIIVATPCPPPTQAVINA